MKKWRTGGATSETPFFYKLLPSPFGDLGIVWINECQNVSVQEILLPKPDLPKEIQECYPGAREDSHPLLLPFENQLQSYLNGARVSFSLSVLDWNRCYGFQQKVLQKAFEIPRGKVASYGALAEKIGAPRAARAVGSAMARNPFPLVYPCHRVVKSTGHLGNFGGGLDLKKALLILEGVAFGTGYMADRRFHW